MGFGVWGFGFGVWGLGFGVWGFGFGVWGLGFRPPLECLEDFGGLRGLKGAVTSRVRSTLNLQVWSQGL